MKCRYNTFFILYPIGASSEWWLMYRALGEAKVFNEYYYYWILLNMAMYPFGMLTLPLPLILVNIGNANRHYRLSKPIPPHDFTKTQDDEGKEGG